MGESAQEKQADRSMVKIDDLGKRISGFDPTILNRFDNYKSPFDFGAKQNELDSIYNLGRDRIERDTSSAIADNTKGTTGRLASQGVTGGSVLDEAVKRGQKDIYKGKQSALASLTSDRANADIGLMNQENRDQFNITNAAGNMDMQNIMNLFRKYGLMQSNLGLRTGNQQNFSSSNTWDDIFGGLNAVGGLASSIYPFFSSNDKAQAAI